MAVVTVTTRYHYSCTNCSAQYIGEHVDACHCKTGRLVQQGARTVVRLGGESE